MWGAHRSLGREEGDCMSDFTFTFHFHTLDKEMAKIRQVLSG